MLTLRDIRCKIGQLIITGFDGYEIPVELRSVSREFNLAGIILFDRNVAGPEQVFELSRQAQSMASDLPLWVSVDQEGGRVARLRAPFTEWPPVATLGRCGDVVLAERFGKAMAAELRAVGISLDFAPVLDVATNSKNPVIGDRALASDAGMVAKLGKAIIHALQFGGVTACAKHFPGHGDTEVDSHLELPVVNHFEKRLHEVELVPFQAAIEADVAAIMTAHISLPVLDSELPVTLSPTVLEGLLRDKLHYNGLVVSDDLTMRAISDRYTQADAAVMAISAGCDVVLLCDSDQDSHVETLEALIRAVENNVISRFRLAEALSRQERIKRQFLFSLQPPVSFSSLQSLISLSEHLAVADEMSKFLK